MRLFSVGPNYKNRSNKEVLSVKPNLSLLVSKGVKGKHSWCCQLVEKKRREEEKDEK